MSHISREKNDLWRKRKHGRRLSSFKDAARWQESLKYIFFSTSSYFTCHLIREKKFVLHMIKSMGTPLCQTCIVVQITQRNYIPDNRFPHGLRSLLFRTLGSKAMIIIRGEFFPTSSVSFTTSVTIFIQACGNQTDKRWSTGW